MLFIDLDDFKRVNDGEGHAAGDRLLREVADRLRRCAGVSLEEPDAPREHPAARPERTAEEAALANGVARVGGDEFVVLLGDVGGTADAGAMADAILEALAVPIPLEGRAHVVGSSIGIALYPDDAHDVDGLLTCADTAMYVAKEHTGSVWRAYERAMREDLDARLALESELREALESGGLALHYQPQLRAVSHSPAGVEALVRWEHPERGRIGPDRFIPIAEESGLIGPLGEWVLDESCRQWSRWREAGIAPERIAVNVSQRQFALGDIAASVASALARHAMPASALEIEITESCVMEGAEDVVRTLERIRETGVHVAMDDFGTGHSSLGALATLPIDTLKIDRCFVTGVVADSASERIVRAILELGTGLGLAVVAEGVENAEELAYLEAHGCDVLQGYHLSRPLCAADATSWLDEAFGGTLRTVA